MNNVIKNVRGQTLLELVLALGLVIAIVTAITITTTTGLKSSEFSKTQVQATKLAQEGLEATKLVKDQNNVVCGPSAVTRWDSLWATTCNSTTACTYRLNSTAGSCLPSIATTEQIWLSNNSVPDSFDYDGITYNRIVRILDNGALNRKEVIVEVSWTDPSGPHTITVSSILAQY